MNTDVTLKFYNYIKKHDVNSKQVEDYVNSINEYINIKTIAELYNYKLPLYMIRRWISKNGTLMLLNNWELKNNNNYNLKGYIKIQDIKKKTNKISISQWEYYTKGIGIIKKYNVGIIAKPLIALEFVKDIIERNYHNTWDIHYLLLEQYKNEFSHVIVPVNFIYKGKKLGSWISKQREAYNKGILLEGRVNKLNELGMVWNYSQFHWNRMFSELKKFNKKNGNILITVDYKVNFPDGTFNLYDWVLKNRVNKKNLSDSQIKKLNILNFNWDLKHVKQLKSWEKGYLYAKNFYKRNGHLRVPEAYIDEDGFYLGSWIRRQRDYYNNGKRTSDQIKRLEQIGMLWNASEQVQTSFEEQAIYFYMKKNFSDTINRDRKLVGTEVDVMIPSLHIGIEYDGPRHHTIERDLKKNGKCKDKIFLIRVRHEKLPVIEKSNKNVYYIKVTSEFTLGDAIAEIYNILNDTYMTKLDISEIDINRDKQKIYDQMSIYVDSIWNKKYVECKKYYQQHGNIDIPYGYMVNGCNLGSWITEQRKSYRLGRLSTDKIKALEKLEIKWRYKDTVWMQKYNEIKLFYKKNNNLSIPNDEQYKSCFYWLHDQKKLYKKGSLSEDRILLLEALGIVWNNVNEYNFNLMCEKLIKYKEENGHCVVPLKYETKDGIRLGLWAGRMRNKINNKTLSHNRSQKLIEIGLPKSNKDTFFYEWLNFAKKYKNENKNLLIPKNYIVNGKNLGRWLIRMRKEYKEGTLKEEYIVELEKIGIVWE